MCKLIDRFLREKSGASAVEFALVLPVFVLVMLGIIAYGIYFGATHSVQQLAADAARASIAGLSDPERIQIANRHVTENARQYALLDVSHVSVEAGPVATDATQFRVAVFYDASSLPIWAIGPILPLPSQTIARTAVVKRGGY
jgi:Flp pilus assembly protein TadG